MLVCQFRHFPLVVHSYPNCEEVTSYLGIERLHPRIPTIRLLGGEPHRNRTCNLLIKSQLLCQIELAAQSAGRV